MRIIVEQDGVTSEDFPMYFAHFDDFINLQESESGFGESEEKAIAGLEYIAGLWHRNHKIRVPNKLFEEIKHGNMVFKPVHSCNAGDLNIGSVLKIIDDDNQSGTPIYKRIVQIYYSENYAYLGWRA